MPKYAKRTKRSSGKRRYKTTRKRPQMRLMKRVAKRVALSLTESKRFALLNESFITTMPAATSTTWFVRNIFAPPGQNVLSSGIIGSEIVNPLLKLKFNYTVNWGLLRSDNLGNYGTVRLNLFLIAVNEQYDFTVPTRYATITPSPFWFINSNGHRVTLNGNNVKVLKKWSRRVTPPPLAQEAGIPMGIVNIPGTLKYRWKRKLTYEDSGISMQDGGFSSSNILRGWNYYILAGAATQTAVVGAINTPQLEMDSFLYFKDP